jgi:hypothetical protein
VNSPWWPVLTTLAGYGLACLIGAIMFLIATGEL